MLLLDPIEVICRAAPDSDKGIDWLGLLPTGIAFLAFLVSIRAATQGKRLEFRTKRFERVAIQPVESSFIAIDQLFQSHGASLASATLQELTEAVTNMNLLLLRIRAIFPALEYAAIVDAGSDFTDSVFNNQTQQLSFRSGDYALWKILVIDALYKSLDKEIGGWWRELREWVTP